MADRWFRPVYMRPICCRISGIRTKLGSSLRTLNISAWPQKLLGVAKYADLLSVHTRTRCLRTPLQCRSPSSVTKVIQQASRPVADQNDKQRSVPRGVGECGSRVSDNYLIS